MHKKFNYRKKFAKKYNLGLNSFGEKLNGRIAMIGIISLILIEISFKKGILELFF